MRGLLRSSVSLLCRVARAGGARARRLVRRLRDLLRRPQGGAALPALARPDALRARPERRPRARRDRLEARGRRRRSWPGTRPSTWAAQETRARLPARRQLGDHAPHVRPAPPSDHSLLRQEPRHGRLSEPAGRRSDRGPAHGRVLTLPVGVHTGGRSWHPSLPGLVVADFLSLLGRRRRARGRLPLQAHRARRDLADRRRLRRSVQEPLGRRITRVSSRASSCRRARARAGRRGGGQLPRLLAQHDGLGRARQRRDDELRAADPELDALVAAEARRRAGEVGESARSRPESTRTGAPTPGTSTRPSSSRAAASCASSRSRVRPAWLVLVEAELAPRAGAGRRGRRSARGGADHLQIARGGGSRGRSMVRAKP